MAMLAAALILLGMSRPAVGAPAQTVVSFQEIPLETPVHRSHVLAYVTLVLGAGLIAESFDLAHRADHVYDEYLVATDPAAITNLYDRTVRYDRLSSGALLGGEVLLAGGLYLRFLRRPWESRVSLRISTKRCALAVRF